MKGEPATHECEPPIDGMIQHRWTCKKSEKIKPYLHHQEG